jgi:hypothetical protein
MRYPFTEQRIASRPLRRGAGQGTNPEDTGTRGHVGLRARSAGLLTAVLLTAGMLAPGPVPAYAADTVPPAAPTDVIVGPGSVTNGPVYVSWQAPAETDIAYYQIFRVGSVGATETSEVTYLGRTTDARTYFFDNLPSEGLFEYTVIAVDTAGNASVAGAPWAAITGDFDANGAGTILPDVTAPAAPGSFHAGAAFSKNKAVALSWTKSSAADLWRYIIYRKDATGALTSAGYAEATATTFSDTVQTDGAYTYYAAAQDKTGNLSAPSASAAVTVDNIAPAVLVTAPIEGQSYARTGSLTITAAITEEGAGYEPAAVTYYLDGTKLANPTLALSNLSQGTHTVKVDVTDRAGNTGSDTVHFAMGTASADPNAPQNLTAPVYSKSRTVPLTWSAPSAGTVTQYTVYRTNAATGQTTKAGITAASVTRFTDTVSADGTYAYYVVAQNGTTISTESNLAVTVVDTAAPVITISTPEDGATYDQSGKLTVAVNVTDAHRDATRTRFWLDGQSFTATEIDLAGLAAGDHTFRVDAADLAGNTGTEKVTFQVGAGGTGDDEDDDHHQNQALMTLLMTFQGRIPHGHYTALMAKLRSGHVREFTAQVIKFRGKFIPTDVADALLKEAGVQVQAWDRINEEHSGGWGHGKGHH